MLIKEKIIKDLYETDIPSLFFINFIKKYEQNNIYKDKIFYKIKEKIFDFIFLFTSSNKEYITSSLYKKNRRISLNLLNDIYSREIKNNYLKLNNTKTRGEINYSNKKIWKQKGTGHARIGSRKAPSLRGGGIIFGPKYRYTKLKINKKLKKKLIKNIFFLQKNKFSIISQNNNILSFYKTKNILNYLNLNKNKKIKQLILVSNNLNDEISNKLKLLLNNVPNIKIIRINNLTIKDCLINFKIYILENSIIELLHFLL